MAEFDDLINEFGSKGKATANVVVSPYADLINEFGSGTIKAQAPAQTEADVLLGPPTPDKLEKSKEIAAAAAQARKDAPIDISTLPIVRQGIEGFKQGGELAGQGYSDISKGLSAQGVGKVALGHGQQLLNVIPVLPTIEAAREQIEKLTGNKEFADRAELVATSGLPIAKTAKAITATMPSSRAVKTLVDAIGPERIPEVIERLKSNPRLTLMDVDPNVQVISQGLASKPGEPRNILDTVVKGRTDSKLDTVTGAIDEALGVPVNVLDKVNSLKSNIRAAGKEINPIVASAGPVDLSNVISSIDAKLKPGVNSVISMGEPLPLGDIERSLKGVRKLLTDDKSVRTDPNSLHAFQSSLRAKAEDLLSSSSGQDRQLGRALMDVRNQVVEAIDKASPQIKQADGTSTGTYKSALAKYRDVNDVDNAFKKGQLITKNRLGNLEDDPSYWDKWIKQASTEELEAAREGARLTVAQQMGAVTNAARKGMDIPQVEFNREKLKLLFGKEEVEKMHKALMDEKTIADTNAKLFANSQTAMRLLGADATKVRPDYEPKFTRTILPVALEAGSQYLTGGSVPALGLAAGLAYPFGRSKITKIGQNLDRKTNVEIADLASSVGEARENLIKALQAHVPPGKLTMKQRLQLSLPIQKP